MGVGKAVGKGVVISVVAVSCRDDGLYGMHVEFGDGVAFGLSGGGFVEYFKVVERLGEAVDLFTDAVVFGVGKAVKGVGVLSVAFVVVFRNGGGAYVRHTSPGILGGGSNVNVLKNGVFEGA